MKKQTIIAIILDIVLLGGIVVISQLVQDHEISLSYYHLWLFFIWTFLSVFFGKYHFDNLKIGNEITAVILNAITVWGLMSLFVISFKIYHKNYNKVFIQILIVVAIELIVRLVYYLINRRKYSKNKVSFFQHLHFHSNNWSAMFINLLWIFIAFMVLIWIKPATMRIYLPNFYPFLIGLLIWEVILNLITKKHRKIYEERFRNLLFSIWKTKIITIFLISIAIYIFKLYHYSRMIIFGTIFLSGFLESVYALYVSQHIKLLNNIDDSHKILHITKLDEKVIRENDRQPAIYSNLPEGKNNARISLRNNLKKECSIIITHLDEVVNINGIQDNECTILSTQTLFNIESLQNNSLKLLINLHPVNDFRNIQLFFNAVNEKISMGGYFVGCGKTKSTVYRRIKKQYPRYISSIIYFFNFIFHRVFPKLPLTREIIYFLNHGKKRTLTKTEILGRMVYAGYKIIRVFEINDMLYFIASKVNTPILDEPPKYGPIISLKRVGENGKTINVLKLRTMHPYAEYLHEYMAENYGYKENGKLQHDFRIPAWGRIFRKYWLDELPQLINWFRGELKLVGPRAFSKEYLKNYPQEIVKRRMEFKPGCIPTYVSLKMDTGVEDRIRSEIIYMDSKEKRPLLTDFKFFIKALYNMITRKTTTG